MIEAAIFASKPTMPGATESAPSAARKNAPVAFRMLLDQNGEEVRIDGTMPGFARSATARDDIAAGLGAAAKRHGQPSGAAALGYNGEAPAVPEKDDAGFGFGDLLDMVNPLQHIPVVGALYREATGDTIRPVSRVVGGGLFGGPLGAIASLANAIFAQETGQDMGETVISAFSSRGPKTAEPIRT